MSDATEKKVYDIYAPVLNFKKAVGVLNHPAISIDWIPEDHIRRIKNYDILTAFYFGYSRDYRFSPESGASGNNDDIMEEGTPAWLCDRIKSKLLGDKVTLTLSRPRILKTLKDLQKQTEEAGAGSNNTPTQNETGIAIIAPPANDLQKQLDTLTILRDSINAREQYLQDWFEENNILELIDENETKASYLGDCVYMVEWKEDKPLIRTYDPAFFFPFYNINADSLQTEVRDFVSDRVYIAWEEYTDTIGATITPPMTNLIWHDIYELRIMPDKTKRCFRHYGYFEVEAGRTGISLEAFDDADIIQEGSSYKIPGNVNGWYDLGIDFMPFVLIPNIKVQGFDFGLSNLSMIIGLLDAIMNNGTDLKKNSEKLGGAVIALSGKDANFPKDATTGDPLPIKIQPNTVYALGENGRMDLLNTAQMQTALLDTGKRLLDSLIRNTGITEIGAGLIQGQAIPSGIALTIMMQPLIDKILPMRNVRKSRYTWLFYMVQKLYQVFGNPEEKTMFAEPLYNANLNFGSIVPTDKSAALDYYIKLGSIVDEQSVLEKMQEDGFDIDPELVIERIKQESAQKIAQQQAAFAAGAGNYGVGG